MKQALGPIEYAGKHMPYGRGSVAGNFVFLSGSVGRHPETRVPVKGVRNQLFIALDWIRDQLKEVGTSVENIVKITWYLCQRSDLEEFRQARAEWFQHNCPTLEQERGYASTMVVDVGLAFKEYLLEVDVVAYKP